MNCLFFFDQICVYAKITALKVDSRPVQENEAQLGTIQNLQNNFPL